MGVLRPYHQNPFNPGNSLGSQVITTVKSDYIGDEVIRRRTFGYLARASALHFAYRRVQGRRYYHEWALRKHDCGKPLPWGILCDEDNRRVDCCISDGI